MQRKSTLKGSGRAAIIGTAVIMSFSNQSVASPEIAVEVQSLLVELGFEVGSVDGIFGNRTKRALEAFYKNQGGRFDGDLSSNEVDDLKSAIQSTRALDESKKSIIATTVHKADFALSLSELSRVSTIEVPEYSDGTTVVGGIGVFDVNRDKSNEVFLCATTYTNWADNPVIILEANSATAIDSTTKFFGSDVPTSNNCPHIYFPDLNVDGLSDVVYSDAGSDAPPYKGTAIEVALNNGTGFTRITPKFEEETYGIRSYSVAAGNFDDDIYGEIILSSGMVFSESEVRKSRIIQFEGDEVSLSKNPFVNRGLWVDASSATNMQVADIDADGKNDIYVGGSWDTPANKIFWSGTSARDFKTYNETKVGRLYYENVFKRMKKNNGKRISVQGSDITSTAIFDFDGDGDMDIVSAYEEINGTCAYNADGGIGCGYNANLDSPSHLQVLAQTSRREFDEVEQDFDSDLGTRYFLDPIVFDINADGLSDIIFNYFNKGGDWVYGYPYGSTIMMNKGDMQFQEVEAKSIAGYTSPIGGMIFPISGSDGATKVLVLQPLSGRQGERPRRLASYTALLNTAP